MKNIVKFLIVFIIILNNVYAQDRIDRPTPIIIDSTEWNTLDGSTHWVFNDEVGKWTSEIVKNDEKFTLHERFRFITVVCENDTLTILESQFKTYLYTKKWTGRYVITSGRGGDYRIKEMVDVKSSEKVWESRFKEAKIIKGIDFTIVKVKEYRDYEKLTEFFAEGYSSYMNDIHYIIWKYKNETRYSDYDGYRNISLRDIKELDTYNKPDNIEEYSNKVKEKLANFKDYYVITNNFKSVPVEIEILKKEDFNTLIVVDENGKSILNEKVKLDFRIKDLALKSGFYLYFIKDINNKVIDSGNVIIK
jgi:hypothetical protein